MSRIVIIFITILSCVSRYHAQKRRLLVSESAENNLQTLSFSGAELGISGANQVDIRGICIFCETDEPQPQSQTLSFSNPNLGLSDANSVDLSDIIAPEIASRQAGDQNIQNQIDAHVTDDNDMDSTNEFQKLSIKDGKLQIGPNGNQITLMLENIKDLVDRLNKLDKACQLAQGQQTGSFCDGVREGHFVPTNMYECPCLLGDENIPIPAPAPPPS
eukprot:316376_1